MRVFVTGVNGQLGYDTALELVRRGHDVTISGTKEIYSGLPGPLEKVPYVQLDITARDRVHAVLTDVKPEAVIHCAAWTAVDAAEEAENKDEVWVVNVLGTQYIAEACRDIDAVMVHISTDYIFNGQGTEPWPADCQDFAPLNVYGASKLASEKVVATTLQRFFIVRIAWVFGPNGKNFVKTMLNLGKTHDTLRVVADQIGTPTYTPDAAITLADMISSDKYGYYHVTNSGGYLSWYDFACEIFRQAGCDVKVIPVTTAEYGAAKAARPFNSRLDTSKLEIMGFRPLPAWQDALQRYIAWEQETEKRG